MTTGRINQVTFVRARVATHTHHTRAMTARVSECCAPARAQRRNTAAAADTRSVVDTSATRDSAVREACVRVYGHMWNASHVHTSGLRRGTAQPGHHTTAPLCTEGWGAGCMHAPRRVAPMMAVLVHLCFSSRAPDVQMQPGAWMMGTDRHTRAHAALTSACVCVVCVRVNRLRG